MADANDLKQAILDSRSLPNRSFGIHRLLRSVAFVTIIWKQENNDEEELKRVALKIARTAMETDCALSGVSIWFTPAENELAGRNVTITREDYIKFGMLDEESLALSLILVSLDTSDLERLIEESDLFTHDTHATVKANPFDYPGGSFLVEIAESKELAQDDLKQKLLAVSKSTVASDPTLQRIAFSFPLSAREITIDRAEINALIDAISEHDFIDRLQFFESRTAQPHYTLDADDLRKAILNSNSIPQRMLADVQRHLRAVALATVISDPKADSEEEFRRIALNIGKLALEADPALWSVNIRLARPEYGMIGRYATMSQEELSALKLVDDELAMSLVRVGPDLNCLINDSGILPQGTNVAVLDCDIDYPWGTFVIQIGKFEDSSPEGVRQKTLAISKLIFTEDPTVNRFGLSFQGRKVMLDRVAIELLNEGFIDENAFMARLKFSEAGTARHMI